MRRPLTSTLFPYTTLFRSDQCGCGVHDRVVPRRTDAAAPGRPPARSNRAHRSEEHTSELQSHVNLVCRLLLEKKKIKTHRTSFSSTITFTTITSSRACPTS